MRMPGYAGIESGKPKLIKCISVRPLIQMVSMLLKGHRSWERLLITGQKASSSGGKAQGTTGPLHMKLKDDWEQSVWIYQG